MARASLPVAARLRQSNPWRPPLAAIIAAMLLAVDVGNTQTHVGLFRDDELVEHWRMHTARTATADELALVLNALLRLRDLRLSDVDAAMVSCVVPALAQEYDQMRLRYLDGRGALVGPSMKTGMPIRIDNPRELGADRLVNAIAAYERIGGACIAVDFGTALNYDVVSSEGEYLGGVISPGVEISLEALSQRAAALPEGAAGPPARRHRPGDAGGDPVGRGLRLRRPGRRPGRPPARGARGGGRGHRHGRLRRHDRAPLRADRRDRRAAHAQGLRIIWERNREP